MHGHYCRLQYLCLLWMYFHYAVESASQNLRLKVSENPQASLSFSITPPALSKLSLTRDILLVKDPINTEDNNHHAHMVNLTMSPCPHLQLILILMLFCPQLNWPICRFWNRQTLRFSIMENHENWTTYFSSQIHRQFYSFSTCIWGNKFHIYCGCRWSNKSMVGACSVPAAIIDISLIDGASFGLPDIHRNTAPSIVSKALVERVGWSNTRRLALIREQWFAAKKALSNVLIDQILEEKEEINQYVHQGDGASMGITSSRIEVQKESHQSLPREPSHSVAMCTVADTRLMQRSIWEEMILLSQSTSCILLPCLIYVTIVISIRCPKKKKRNFYCCRYTAFPNRLLLFRHAACAKSLQLILRLHLWYYL